MLTKILKHLGRLVSIFGVSSPEDIARAKQLSSLRGADRTSKDKDEIGTKTPRDAESVK